MSNFLLTVPALVFCLSGVTYAGPNSSGTLIVHNPSLAYLGLGYSACGQGLPLMSCSRARTELDGSDNSYWVWKVYAAFPDCSHPRLKALDFGVQYSYWGLILVDYGVCHSYPYGPNPFPDWPRPGSGTAIVFTTTQTTTLVECYWFAGYAYYGTPGQFALTPGPYGGDFGDDGEPPTLDPIAGFGSLGFNQPGHAPCPPSPASGACCLSTTCAITAPCDCQGRWQGPGTTCNPDPCLATPVQTETWGRIKSAYR